MHISPHYRKIEALFDLDEKRLSEKWDNCFWGPQAGQPPRPDKPPHSPIYFYICLFMFLYTFFYFYTLLSLLYASFFFNFYLLLYTSFLDFYIHFYILLFTFM